MSTRRIFLLTALTAFAVVLVAPHSHAAGPCIDDAKRQFKDCKATCKEDFQVAKDACLNRDHDCVEVCRARRAECRDAHPAATPARDQCIDQVQVIGFQCRDDAREAARPALRRCRRSFRVCAYGCALPGTPDRAGVRQGKIDALATYVTCQTECVEDRQVAKDACLNRDHVCVERCRADRENCRQPILTELASDVAACNGTRDAAIQNCKDLFAEGTPDRDQCCDNAQVEAFQCRDQAREDAAPGLRTCRANFRTCVEGCPLI